MGRVVEVSRDQLEERRGRILQRLGVSEEDLRQRAEDSALIGEEWEAWREIQDIAFLLEDAEQPPRTG